jgi:hypothetical protein
MEQKIKEEVKKQIAEMVANGLPAGVGEIVIREGKAVELKEPVKVKIQGTIDSAARWLETRFDCIKEKTCHVIVNREQLTIALQCNENNHYGTLVVGSLTLSPEYKRFGINEGEYITNFEMAELIKMNRSFFENKSVAMKLVTDLQNFKAKVDKEIEQSNNNRGDRRILINQAVEHNLPEAFTLILPIFKGTAKQTIAVEVYVNPSDFSCTLVSPEANDLVEEMRDREIDAVLERIKERCPDIVIIEQ